MIIWKLFDVQQFDDRDRCICVSEQDRAMAKDSTTAPASGETGTAQDFTRIFGALEEARLMAILDRRPTVLEVEGSIHVARW